MARRSPSVHRHDDCENKIFQRIDVAGEVTISPKVECGPVSVTCLEGRIIPCEQSGWKPRKSAGRGKCKVFFVQELLVEVPVEVQVETECNLVGVRCNPPTVDPAACLPELGNSPDSSDSSSESSGTPDSWGDASSCSSESQDSSEASGSQ